MKRDEKPIKEEFVRYIRRTGTSLGINIPFEVIEVLELKEKELVKVLIRKIETGKSFEFVKHVRKTGTSLGINIPFEVIEVLELKENEIVRVIVEKAKGEKLNA